MWTINDLPVYGMVSGWSTYKKLACPYCMENNEAFTLMNGGKTFFFCLPSEVLAMSSSIQKK
jgi:ABC-type anion transport system duplicated permease subunit